MAKKRSKDKHAQIREAAESDLLTFIHLIAPHRELGGIHEELIRWWCRDDGKSHQLVLLPRDHQKSTMVAYRVAWEITRNPAVTVLYISSTSNLAEKQLKFIKDILNGQIYRRYWPDMTHPDEGKREKWTNSEISVDHPIRQREGVRDPTVFTAGLTTSITGLHCTIAVLDDVVVMENAYTNEGRDKVKSQYSLLASIESAGAREWAVGTRYHPSDLYDSMLRMTQDVIDENDDIVDQEPVYEIYQREVEDRGDGTGSYLWPRQQRGDGQWFGFNARILSKKRAQYLDRTQYHAQYYNNPNDPDHEAISSDYFQYYDRKYLELSQGVWFFKGKKLNVFAAIDFAFSLRRTADYTAIVTVGVDSDNNMYVLDIDRFRAKQVSVYFEHIKKSHVKWGYRKLRAEVTVAQEAIVQSLRHDHIRKDGLILSVDPHRPTRHDGTKKERIHAELAPRYENGQVWHYHSGITTELETELIQDNPRHDDIKDALASAIAICIAPASGRKTRSTGNVLYHRRFGGVQA